ncbi:CLUMA_CG007882, isoform B [Clunio marinus]|uniref:CLUMA_CG007882, isoform B n=1 Tax=Clunio marinus TaxID=568069 RepID=A0A1J1I255_9DIPT|nr:CLUMA_CG007882, isoform B [Clunio marinus]
MAKAESRHNNNELQTNESGTDEVEKSLELLDKVLSEFEEEQENSPAGEPESPSQGHQSEDDGYMSMNGRRAKFVPDFQPTEEVAQPALSTQPNVPPDEKLSPPTPEEAERIISHLLPRISPSTTQGELNNSAMPCIEFKFINNNNSIRSSNISFGTKYPMNVESEASSALNSIVSTNAPLQTTLPKTRPATVVPSRYASLPSSNTPRNLEHEHHPGGNVYIGRNFIGIGINDVHNAVLKSGARMPETIVNEHPVTIYPGPLPQKRVPPRTLPGSIERHREVCRKNPSSDHSSSSTSSSSSQELKSPIKELTTPPIQPNNGFILKNDDFIKRPKSPMSTAHSPSNAPPFGIKISIQSMDNLMNNRNIIHNAKMEQKMNMKNSKRNSRLSNNEDDDDDKFSDDSLEDISLPPPAPPPVIPPPPSLSAPVTPSKRHSIAWEVNLDDLCSSDDVVPPGVDISDGRGTYVIKKGRRRQRIDDFAGSASMSSINSKLSNEGLCNDSNSALNVPSPVYPPSMMMPNSRHSIDLGGSPRHHKHQHSYHPPNVVNTPRSRLSLDLSSPTVTNTGSFDKAKTNTPTSSSTPTATKSPSVTKLNTPTSPLVANSAPFPSRYTEFKTYSSTFDGLQALESHNGSANITVNGISGNRVAPQVSSSPDNPLMRVSSLPAIPPQNQLSGESASTPRRELAPPIEEDEEDSDGTRAAPLRQIENNISALLRGEIQVAQVPAARPTRPMGFRPGVHKSESAKEMLLSQQYFGPLPASPPSSSPEMDSDEFPPLPPSPSPEEPILSHGIQNIGISSRGRIKSDHSYRKEHRAPAIPAHAPSLNTLKTRSMDAGFSKSYRNGSVPASSPRSPGRTLPPDLPSSCTTIGSSARHRSINHALQANGEMLRLSGLPARGWYPKQRHARSTASTEHLDRLHQGSMRAWDSSACRKPTTLPPNMTPPKFFNKSPREALRRVTSLLINRKGNSTPKEKESNKREKLKERDTDNVFVQPTTAVQRSPRSLGDIEPPPQQKKKGFFKSFWKKSRHYSLEQN